VTYLEFTAAAVVTFTVELHEEDVFGKQNDAFRIGIRSWPQACQP